MKMPYFKMDVNALSDRGMMMLERKHGMAGLGRWLVLTTMVYTDMAPLDLSDPDMRELVADKLRMDPGELDGFVTDLVRFGLANQTMWDMGKVISDRAGDEMAFYVETSEKRKAAGRKGGKTSEKANG